MKKKYAKKQYSKKQITEAIAYWKRRLDEAVDPQPIDVGSYVFDEKLECCGGKHFRADVHSKENNRSVLYFSWYEKYKYIGNDRYVKSSVFNCYFTSHANGGADEWICDIARDKSLADAQKLYEKIRDDVKADAPVTVNDLEKSVRKAVVALGLNTRQSKWYERVGTDHGLDEENGMKKKYTKKQITEAIAYWEKQLKRINESQASDRKYGIPLFNIARKLDVDIETVVKCIGEMMLDQVRSGSDLPSKFTGADVMKDLAGCDTYIEFAFEGDAEGEWEDHSIGAYDWWGHTEYDDSEPSFELTDCGINDADYLRTPLTKFMMDNYGAEVDSIVDSLREGTYRNAVQVLYVGVNFMAEDYQNLRSAKANDSQLVITVENLKPYLKQARNSNAKIRFK